MSGLMAQSKNKVRKAATATKSIPSTSLPGASSLTKRKHKRDPKSAAPRDSERHPVKKPPKYTKPKTKRVEEQATSSSEGPDMASNASATTAINGLGGDYVAFEREEPTARPERSYKGKGKAYQGANGDVATHHSNNGLTPWADKVDWDDCISAAEMLHCEVEAFVDWMSPRREEHELRTLVVEQIRRAVQKTYPKAEVTAFGSYETVLYLPSGDLDLVLTIPDVTDPLKILFKLPNIITRNEVGKAITVISKARVPIVKFTSLIGEFAVDISINMTSGITTGQLVNRFLSYHPALRYLVIVVKTFLSQRLMNEVHSGGLGSYSITLMCLSFLQMHPKIRNGEINPMHNLGVLAVEFFEFYGHYFQYETVGICLRNGGCYYRKDDRGWAKLNKPSLLSIEDPNMESNDVSGGSHAIDKVRRTFAGAFEVLNATMIQRSMEIGSRKTPKGSRSILGTLVGVSQTMYDRRRAIYDIYWSGTLQDTLGMPVRPAPPIPRPPKHPATRHTEDYISLASDSSSLATLPASKAAASSQPMADEGQRKRKRSPSVDPLEERESASPQRANGGGEEDEGEDSRYGAVQPRQRKRKSVIDIVFVSDDEASDGVEMVTNVAEIDKPGQVPSPLPPPPPLGSSDSSTRRAVRREFWRAKAGDSSALEEKGDELL
ncbi:hypothetical protein FRB95_011759 [Tulasnella sp. JGI-2019a]|nr:hypothetical protein FRB95_011759 [Tulasnella sp. JGI-2019a]